MSSDYFTDELLSKLDTADPIFAAYEAQDVSRSVGFDFASFQDVVPRALNEIRETKEAYGEHGSEGRVHFGDEIADIMFSLINLARHAGVSKLPAFEKLESKVEIPLKSGGIDAIELIDSIGAKINNVAEIDDSNQGVFLKDVRELFEIGMTDTILLARASDFDPRSLLLENVRKYLMRCQAIEQLASTDHKRWADLSANGEIITYWEKAKVLLK